MEHATEGCTCEGRKCAICEETKCHGRFKAPTTFNCTGCRKAYQKGYHAGCANKGKPKDPEPREPEPKVTKSKGRHSSAEYQATWRKEHREQHLIQRRQYRKNHPENPDKVAVRQANLRARKAGIEGIITLEEWLALKAFYNNTCLDCGCTDVKLCLDHIVPLDRRGPNYIDNIQPLCMPCNSRKHTKTLDFRPKRA